MLNCRAGPVHVPYLERERTKFSHTPIGNQFGARKTCDNQPADRVFSKLSPNRKEICKSGPYSTCLSFIYAAWEAKCANFLSWAHRPLRRLPCTLRATVLISRIITNQPVGKLLYIILIHISWRPHDGQSIRAAAECHGDVTISRRYHGAATGAILCESWK